MEGLLSLGPMPLANAFLTEDELGTTEERFALDLGLCVSCGLVQITETVPAEKLFQHYLYFSSFSTTFLRHAEQLSQQLVQERRLDGSSRVIEIGSNDGYLLQYYARQRIPVLGIEPAQNVARVAMERGVPTLCEFFAEEVGRRLRSEGVQADVLHVHNVLGHVADPNGFVAGLGHLLKDDGLVVIEVPYVREMVDRCEFDTIYHEHLCYFSLHSLVGLLERHQLRVAEVEKIGIHGGSLRLRVERGIGQRNSSVDRLLEEEDAAGIDQPEFYRGFAARVDALRLSLREMLHGLARSGSRIAAYGAAAKGTVLLNALRLESGTIMFVVDRNPHKQGRFLPGVRLPIHSHEALVEHQPDYVLLLTWNLADEVLAQESEYRRRGGRFIIPLPEPRVV